MQAFRAASLFQPSNLAKAIEQTMDPTADSPSYLYGSILAFPHTMVARTIATLGLDFVMIDALHTAIDAENLTRIIHTINFCSEGKTVAVVRVPSAHSDLLTHALDAGAGGIVFPHIDTPEQAAEAASKCRYAYSGGERSLSPCALIPGVTDIAPQGSSHEKVADSHIAVICQIESKLALDNAASIAAVSGVNAMMLGPGDLRVSLGLPSKRVGDYDHPVFLEAIDRLVNVSQAYQKPLMTVSFKVSAETDRWLTKFNLLLATADFVNVVKGHQTDLQNSKNLIKLMSESNGSQDQAKEASVGGAKSNGTTSKQTKQNGVMQNGNDAIVTQ